MTPDLMPVLAAGAHNTPKEGACVMEYVSLLAGEPWSDSPSCTHPVLASMARHVNDRLADEDRHLLVPLIGRLFGTAEAGTDLERRVLSVRLAVWSANQVQHLARSQDAGAVAEAIRCAEEWADEATKKNASAYAYAASAYAASANAAYAAYAAYASANAAYAASYASAAASATNAANAATNAANAANAATNAATNAANAATNAATNAANPAEALVAALTGLIDEYDRLTGRTQPEPDAAQKAQLAYLNVVAVS